MGPIAMGFQDDDPVTLSRRVFENKLRLVYHWEDATVKRIVNLARESWSIIVVTVIGYMVVAAAKIVTLHPDRSPLTTSLLPPVSQSKPRRRSFMDCGPTTGACMARWCRPSSNS